MTSKCQIDLTNAKPSGLYNPGNFCYLCSTIQALPQLPIIKFFNKNLPYDNILYSIINFFSLNLCNDEETNTIIDVLKIQINQLFESNQIDNIHNKFIKSINVDIKNLLGNFKHFAENINNAEELNNLDDEINENDNIIILKEYKKLINNPEFIQNIINIKLVYIITSYQVSLDRFLWFLDKIRKNKIAILLYDNLKSFIVQLKNFNQTLTPVNIINTINLFVQNSDFSHIVDGNQQDVHEILQLIIYGLHESHSDKLDFEIPSESLTISENELESLDINQRIKHELNKQIYNTYKSDNFSPLIKDMHFFTLKLIQCRNCDHKSINFDDTSCILTEIPKHLNNNASISIYDCLESHFAVEELEDYKCDKCKQKNSVLLNMLVTKPKSLIITLKRFMHHPLTGQASKIYNNVSYPSILNVSKYCSVKNEEGNMYKLSCVINHIGNVHGGHYYTYSYNETLNNWYNLNDMNVSKININDVLNNKNAYVLIYSQM